MSSILITHFTIRSSADSEDHKWFIFRSMLRTLLTEKETNDEELTNASVNSSLTKTTGDRHGINEV